MVVDTSALMAILEKEPAGRDLSAALSSAPRLLISAATLAESLIVAHGRGVGEEMAALLRSLQIEVVPVTEAAARRAAEAYARWGKGLHPTALNYGDCFAYGLARAENLPLLYIGDDFARTDVRSALA